MTDLDPLDRSISVVIPVYNNGSTVQELYARLVTSLSELTSDFEVIFVDDGSTDGARGQLKSMALSDSRCVALLLSRNFGQHPAIAAGLERATGSVTVLMDADLEDRPEELAKLVETLWASPDVDVVYTTFADSHSLRPTSRLFWWLFGNISGLNLPPGLGTFRVFRANVRREVLLYSERGAVYGPLMAQMGFSAVYVKVVRDVVPGRKSSYSLRKRVALGWSSVISYSSRLHSFAAGTGFLVSILSATYLVIALFQYAFGERVLINGQFLLLSVTLLMSGVLLMSVGIVGAYAFRTFNEVLARPRYHISREFGDGIRSQHD